MKIKTLLLLIFFVSSCSQLPADDVTSPEVSSCVNAHALNIRKGPGTEFDSLGYLQDGDCVELLARNNDGSWVQSKKGWLSSRYLDTKGDISQLPIADVEVSLPKESESIKVPDGFEHEYALIGVTLYKKEYGDQKQDFVQVISLAEGASIKILYGDLNGPGDEVGFYGGNNPKIYRQGLQEFWEKFSNSEADLFCVTNGQFFADVGSDSRPIDPTTIAFPLKADGTIVSEGHDDKNYSSNQKLMLEIWEERAKISVLPMTREVFESSTAPNIITGLDENANKRRRDQTGRTFIGVADIDLDNQNETILIFNSKLATQEHASKILKDFGANNVMMLDGGNSTQLICQNSRLVNWNPDWTKERSLPHTIATVAANPQDWYQNNIIEEGLESINREIDRINKILEEVEQTVQAIRDLYDQLTDTEKLAEDLVESIIQDCGIQIIVLSSLAFVGGFYLRKRNY